MFKRLFKARRKPTDPPPAAVPPGRRVYAVGDIHGRRDLLDAMLALIEADNAGRPAAEVTLIFLGDLVDRGPQSAAVIERLLDLDLAGIATHFLLGNHDEIFLKAAGGDGKAMRMLTRIGGRQTMTSYGVDEADLRGSDNQALAARLAALVPDAHRAFLARFEDMVAIGDYLFVHAGIKPGVPFDRQSPADLRWIRAEFLDCQASHGSVVVHGHSISDEPEIRANRIGIDTGAFATGRLTALGLEGAERWFLTAEGAPDDKWREPPG